MKRDAARPFVRAERIDDHVRNRNLVGTDTVDAEQTQDRAFDGNRRMGGNEITDRCGNGSSKLPAALDEGAIDLQFHDAYLSRR